MNWFGFLDYYCYEFRLFDRIWVRLHYKHEELSYQNSKITKLERYGDYFTQ